MVDFENLAGAYAGRCNPAALEELGKARIPAMDVDLAGRIFPETRATKIGVFHFVCGQIAVFTRAGIYWRVRMNQALPQKQAHAVNVLAGNVARAYGMSGGCEVRPSGCDHWNVDTQEGLNLLASALRLHYGDLVTGRFLRVSELIRMKLLDGQVYK